MRADSWGVRKSVSFIAALAPTALAKLLALVIAASLLVVVAPAAQAADFDSFRDSQDVPTAVPEGWEKQIELIDAALEKSKNTLREKQIFYQMPAEFSDTQITYRVVTATDSFRSSMSARWGITYLCHLDKDGEVKECREKVAGGWKDCPIGPGCSGTAHLAYWALLQCCIPELLVELSTSETNPSSEQFIRGNSLVSKVTYSTGDEYTQTISVRTKRNGAVVIDSTERFNGVRYMRHVVTVPAKPIKQLALPRITD